MTMSEFTETHGMPPLHPRIGPQVVMLPNVEIHRNEDGNAIVTMSRQALEQMWEMLNALQVAARDADTKTPASYDDNARMRTVICDMAHLAGTLGTGADGWLRGRFMSISNALNAVIDRTQSSHGDQFDRNGKIIKRDVHKDI